MDENQRLSPPESEKEPGAPRRRQGITRFWWILLTLVLVLAVAATILLLRNGGEQVAGEAAQISAAPIAVATVDKVTAEPVEIPFSAPPPTEPAVEDSMPTDEAGSVAQEALGEAPPAPSEPAAEPTAESVEPQGAASAGVGRIAIVDQRSRLWTVAHDGSDRRLLSEPGRSYQFPSWSPAGNDIAMIGSDFNGGGVYVVTDEQDSEIRQLYSDRIFQPIYLYWSPEGENVSFIANHPDGLALHMAPRDGGAPQLVTTSPSTFFWDWMPDGSQVLVHTGFTALDSDNSRLAFVPLDDAIQTEEISQNGYFQAPAVAADGRFYSYSNKDPIGNRWLSVHDIDLDRQVELINHQGVVAMGFSPTRPQLAYISPNRPAQSFYGPLRLVDLESDESRELVPETVLAFFWSPDGRFIAYLTLSAIEGPFQFDDAPIAGLFDRLPAGRGANLPGLAKGRLTAKLQSPPDKQARIGLGLSIVDVESGDTRLLTVFEPSTVFINQFLPFFDQYALSHRLWSPDSQALVVPMRDEQERDFIVVVPVDGSDPLPIGRGVAAFWSQQ